MKAKELALLIKEESEKIVDNLLKENYKEFEEKITDNLKEVGDYWITMALRKGGDITLDYDFIDDIGSRPEDVQESPKSNTFDYITEMLVEIYKTKDREPLPYTVYEDPQYNVVGPQIRENIVHALLRIFNVFSETWINFLFGSKMSFKKRLPTPPPPRPKDEEELFQHISYIQETLLRPEEIKKHLANYTRSISFSAMFITSARRKYIDSLRQMNRKKKLKGGSVETSVTADNEVSSLDDPISDDDARTGAEMLADESDTNLSEEELEFITNTFRELSSFIESQVRSPKVKQVFKGLVLHGNSPQELADSEEYPDIEDPKEVSVYLKTIQKNKKINNKFREILSGQFDSESIENITLADMGGVKQFTGGRKTMQEIEDEESEGDSFNITKVLSAFSDYMKKINNIAKS